jgi:hypothetical protein
VLPAFLLPVVAAGVWVGFVAGWDDGAGAGSAVELALGDFEVFDAGGVAGAVDDVDAPRLTPPW